MSRKSYFKQSAKVNATQTTTTYEVDKPAKFTQAVEEPVEEKKRIGWLKIVGIVALALFMLVVIASVLIGWWYVSRFEAAAGQALAPLISTVWKQRKTSQFAERDYKTFMLLGVDQSANQRGESLLTDTLILATLHRDGSVKLVSLPRDLWIDSLKTKVNALYYYGQQTNPGDGITLVSSVVSEISGYPIDYHVLINMDMVKSMIDAIGGVSVPVERGFVDAEYPREVDLTSTDPAVLYETVRFSPGEQVMDGETALKYIRSRHSTDKIEGTDEGREKRQQVLLSALKSQLLTPEVITDPTAMGKLLAIYSRELKTNLSVPEALLLLSQIDKRGVRITSNVIPVKDASTSGVIYHPTVGPAKQWVYLPVDSSWSELRTWLREHL